MLALGPADHLFVENGWTDQVRLPDVGFGLPTLHSLLPIPAGPGLVVIQSWAGSDQAQRFCLEMSLQFVFQANMSSNLLG